MSDKFWNFSKAERIAAIALTIVIVLLLAISLFEKRGEEAPLKDYRTEIEEFKNRVVPADTTEVKKRRASKKQKKVYTPNKQQLSPLKKENK